MKHTPATLLRLLGALLLAATLVACATGRPVHIFPPTASIQQLVVRDDGGWDLSLRLQNFSNVGMRVAEVEARVEIGGVHAATIVQQPDVVVPASSSEIVQLQVIAQPQARAAVAAILSTRDALDYRLSGTIRSSEPKRRVDAFEFESALGAVPGLSGTLR